MNQRPRAIVSAILIKRRGKNVKVFLQTRWKPDKSPSYSGMIEIPAGVINAYENIYVALKREVKEECGLKIVNIIGNYQGPVKKPRKHDKAFVFRPFICQQALETNKGLPWIGFVFLCEVTGDVQMDQTEAKDPRWVTITELRHLIKTKTIEIFPLQLPVLEYFLNYWKNKKS